MVRLSCRADSIRRMRNEVGCANFVGQAAPAVLKKFFYSQICFTNSIKTAIYEHNRSFRCWDYLFNHSFYSSDDHLGAFFWKQPLTSLNISSEILPICFSEYESQVCCAICFIKHCSLGVTHPIPQQLRYLIIASRQRVIFSSPAFSENENIVSYSRIIKIARSCKLSYGLVTIPRRWKHLSTKASKSD